MHVLRFAALIAASTILHVIALFAATTAHADDVDQLIRDGIALHDQRDFSGAIALYAQVIEVDPDNVMAHYEMGLSQQSLKNYQACIKISSAALRIRNSIVNEVDIRPEIYSMLGSCHSADDEPGDALAIFAEGLAEYPQNYWLNFNIAITLSQQGRGGDAIPYLQQAVRSESRMSSPYYVLGLNYYNEGQVMASMLSLLTFLSLENTTERSTHAARQVFDGMMSILVTDDDGQTTIYVAPDNVHVDADLAPLSLELSLLLMLQSPAGEIREPAAESLASLLTSFVHSAAQKPELVDEAKFVGRYLVQPLVSIDKAGVSDVFARFVTYVAGVKGADTWLKDNPERVDSLADYFNMLAIAEDEVGK